MRKIRTFSWGTHSKLSRKGGQSGLSFNTRKTNDGVRSRPWCAPLRMWPCLCMGSPCFPWIWVHPGRWVPWALLAAKHTSSLRGVPAISAPHLPGLSISLPFIFKEYLPAFVWTFFFQHAKPHRHPERETCRLRARHDQTYLCLSLCPQPPGRPILKPPGKWIPHYLDVRQNGLGGEGGTT